MNRCFARGTCRGTTFIYSWNTLICDSLQITRDSKQLWWKPRDTWGIAAAAFPLGSRSWVKVAFQVSTGAEWLGVMGVTEGGVSMGQ